MKNKTMIALMTGLVFCSTVNADVVNGFDQWQNDGGSWSYNTARSEWIQSTQSTTVLFDPTSEALGKSISGYVRVNTSSDDDFMGFVLGYQENEISNGPDTDFWLIDWKQNTQNSGSGIYASRGLRLSHVQNGAVDYWGHSTEAFTTIARGKTLGNRGWSDKKNHSFDIIYDSNLIEVSIDDVLQFSVTASQAGVDEFESGAFGMYSYQQEDVVFGGISHGDARSMVSIEGAKSLTSDVSSPFFASLLAFPLLFSGFRRRK
jgi:hypothetical protein